MSDWGGHFDYLPSIPLCYLTFFHCNVLLIFLRKKKVKEIISFRWPPNKEVNAYILSLAVSDLYSSNYNFSFALEKGF